MREWKRRRRLVDAARELRQPMTPAESALWEQLRDRRLAGIKFRRQANIEFFVVDSCAFEIGLIIEVDDEVHEAQREQDKARTAILESMGWYVIRFDNEQVRCNIASVLSQIEDVVAYRRVSPLPRTGEGPGVRAGR